MKRIGIVTFHKTYNYGAFLQCFALKKILENKFNTYVVDYCCKEIQKSYRLIKTKNFKKLIKSIMFLPQNIKRSIKFKKCINDNFNLASLSSDFDIIIAGSDQIWNIELTGGIDKIYNLQYFDNVKKISYASSIGNEKLISKYPKIYSSIVENIEQVSVREESAKEELSKITNKKIKVNLDPTLLLTKKDWEQYLKGNKIKQKYIFSYFVGVTQENYDVLKEISNKKSLKVISYSENPKEKNILKHCFTDDPFEFITKIKYSELVFTSSFHATVFSILFNKDFYCMPPKDKGNRIINLLKKVGLSDRVILSKEDLNRINLNKKINYKETNKKLKELRKDSISWLLKSIKN